MPSFSEKKQDLLRKCARAVKSKGCPDCFAPLNSLEGLIEVIPETSPFENARYALTTMWKTSIIPGD